MEEETDDVATVELESKLVPCSVCSRTFRPEALERHERICQKTLVKKRKVFDSSKKRAEGTELESLPKSKAADLKKSKEKPKPKSNWREKHEEFIQAIRAAKGIPNDDENNVEINGASKPISVPVGYIQCSSCGRNFSERAADRHISWCKEKNNRVVKSPVSNDASERLKARTKYRAPLPVKKVSSAKSENVTPGNKQSRTPSRDQQKPQPKPVLSDANSHRIVAPQQRPKKVTKPPQKPKPVPDNNAKKTVIKRSDVSRRTVIKSDVAVPVSTRNIMKFKEKFPNHVHRNLIVDENHDEFRQDLRDLLRNNTVFSKAPRTVPGVRTGGQMNTNDTSNRNVYRNNSTATSDNIDSVALQDRMKELGFDVGWAKKLSNWDTKVPDNMPQIGSSENTFEVNNNDPWAPVSADETRASTGNSSSGSDSTLPPISRGSSGSDMGNRLPRFCHQCGTKYPVTIAKYCCECGARRVSNAAVVT